MDKPTNPSSVDATPEQVVGMSACRNCAGCGWVCENHLDAPWPGLTDTECCGGAGSPCPVCDPEAANAGLIYSIAQEARRYAAFYEPNSDGRHTFTMFAEFVETRAIAQAIRARREEAAAMQIKNDSCGPDDPGQDYVDCPNCAAGRIYSLECDCCGWEDGVPLRDNSYRRRPAQAIEARRAETQGGSVHESAVAESDAPETR